MAALCLRLNCVFCPIFSEWLTIVVGLPYDALICWVWRGLWSEPANHVSWLLLFSSLMARLAAYGSVRNVICHSRDAHPSSYGCLFVCMQLMFLVLLFSWYLSSTPPCFLSTALFLLLIILGNGWRIRCTVFQFSFCFLRLLPGCLYVVGCLFSFFWTKLHIIQMMYAMSFLVLSPR